MVKKDKNLLKSIINLYRFLIKSWENCLRSFLHLSILELSKCVASILIFLLTKMFDVCNEEKVRFISKLSTFISNLPHFEVIDRFLLRWKIEIFAISLLNICPHVRFYSGIGRKLVISCVIIRSFRFCILSCFSGSHKMSRILTMIVLASVRLPYRGIEMTSSIAMIIVADL